MRILFTGASSFTGLWFVKALTQAGHTVTPVLRQSYDHYTGIRKQRIDALCKFCQPVYNASFGDPAFLTVVTSATHWDMLCHHAAEVTNYKSIDFNPAAALANNTLNLKTTLQTLKAKGCQRIVLTGSVFEQNEGTGSENLRAVSPYGLSKGLTADTFLFYTSILQMTLGKFVIPNPFGCYEEGRFTSYLAQNWLAGKIPVVNTPAYVRDNIPVCLLAQAYAQFATQLTAVPGYVKSNPSFFAESQAGFTERFSKNMRSRLGQACQYELMPQTDFSEPLVRINTDPIQADQLTWQASEFWDELAVYYTTLHNFTK